MAISYFYKVDDFMDSVGLGDAVIRIDAVSEERLVSEVKRAFASRDEISSTIDNCLPAVKERAERNCNRFLRLLGEA